MESQTSGLSLEPAIERVVQPLSYLDEDSDKATWRSVANEAFNALHEILADPSSDPVMVCEANAMIGQIVLRLGHWSDFAMTGEAVLHLQAALDSRSDYAAKDPTTATAAIWASMLGTALTRQADRANFNDRPQLISDAEDALRTAIALTPEGNSWAATRAVRMSNLATHLTTYARSSEDVDAALEAEALIRSALEIAPAADRSMVTTLWASLGHATRKVALASGLRSGELRDALDSVDDCYENAKKLAEDAGLPDPVSPSDRGLLASHRFTYFDDADALDEAIQWCELGLTQSDDDDDHLARMRMQLAEHHFARFKLEHREEDLRSASTYSSESVEWLYAELDGADRHDLKARRITILETAAAQHGDWGDERADLRRLGDEFLAIEGIDPPAPAQFLHIEDDLRLAKASASGEIDHEACLILADQLRHLALTSHFGDSRLPYVVRSAIAELDVFGSGNGVVRFGHPGVDRILRSISDIRSTLLESSSEPARLRFYALSTLANLLSAVASAEQSYPRLGEAASALDQALDLASQNLEAIPTVNVALAASARSKLNSHLLEAEQDTDAPGLLLTHANALRAATKPTQLLLAESRTRRSFAATAALSLVEPDEKIWVALALDRGLDVFDEQRKEALLASIKERSSGDTQLFVIANEDRTSCVVVHDGELSILELPDLALPQIAPLLFASQGAHRNAKDGSRAAQLSWQTHRTRLISACRRGLAPLGEVVSGARGVDVHLFGYTHIIPIVPSIAANDEYGTSIAAVAAPESVSATPSFGAAIVLAPGVGADYLASAYEDAEYVNALYPGAVVSTNPTPGEAIEVLRNSKIALYIGHATDAQQGPGRSALRLETGEVTVGDMLAADFSACELIVFAACDSFAPDAQVHENALSLASAALYAGAQAAIGSHWRVPDPAASMFTRELFRGLETSNVREAYLHALAASAEDDSVQFTLIVR